MKRQTEEVRLMNLIITTRKADGTPIYYHKSEGIWLHHNLEHMSEEVVPHEVELLQAEQTTVFVLLS